MKLSWIVISLPPTDSPIRAVLYVKAKFVIVYVWSGLPITLAHLATVSRQRIGESLTRRPMCGSVLSAHVYSQFPNVAQALYHYPKLILLKPMFL